MLALVTDAFGGRGGIAQYNRDFVSALASSDDPIAVDILPRFAPERPGKIPSLITQRRAHSNKVNYVVEALRIALKTKPDIIFCGHLYMAPFGAFIARLIGARHVIQLHGIEIWSRPSRSQRNALETADLVLCVSRHTRSEVLRHATLAPHRVRILPNTYAGDFVPGDRAAARARFGIQPGTLCILSVGRLDAREQYKGQDKVIAALSLLRARHPRLIYLISGDGDDRSRLEAQAKEQGVGEVVRFLGHIPREALPDLYRAADLFALPSTGEGFGIVYLEAMACGTPAIGLCVAGARDALADGALGVAASLNDFEVALCRSVEMLDRQDQVLSEAVATRFGKARFAERAGRLFACLLED